MKRPGEFIVSYDKEHFSEFVKQLTYEKTDHGTGVGACRLKQV